MEVCFVLGGGQGWCFCKSTHSYSPLLDVVAAFVLLWPVPVPRNLGKGGPASVGSMLFMLWFASGDCEGGRLWPAAKAAGVNCRACDWGSYCAPRRRGCLPGGARLQNPPPPQARRTDLCIFMEGRPLAGKVLFHLWPVFPRCAFSSISVCGYLPSVTTHCSQHLLPSNCCNPETALSSRNSCSVSQQLGCVHTLLGLHINLLFTVYLCFFCVWSHTQLMLCLPFLVVSNHCPVNDCSSFTNWWVFYCLKLLSVGLFLIVKIG